MTLQRRSVVFIANFEENLQCALVFQLLFLKSKCRLGKIKSMIYGSYCLLKKMTPINPLVPGVH